MTIVYNEPCGEEITSSSGGGNNNNNNSTGSQNNPPDPPVPPPPEFLAPDNYISKVVLTADREINIIPRQYFIDHTNIGGYLSSFAVAADNEDFDGRAFRRRNYFPDNEENPDLPNTKQLVDNLRLDNGAIWIHDHVRPNMENESLLKNTIGNTYFYYNISQQLYESRIAPLQPKVAFAETELHEDAMILKTSLFVIAETNDSDLIDFLAEEYGDGFVQENKTFLDHTFAAKQPFFLDELNYLEASRFISVDIDTYSANYVEYSSDLKETDKTSLYRLYAQKKNPSDSELSDLEPSPGSQDFCKFEDIIQKFTCGAIAEMAEANKTMIGAFDHYVKITINTNQSSKLAEFFDEYNMDKYFLELYTKIEGPVEDKGLPKTVSKPMQVALVQDEDVIEKDENIIATAINDRGESEATVLYLDGIIDSIEGIKNQDFNFFHSGIRKQDYPIPFEFGKPMESNILRFTDTIRSQIFMSKFRDQILTRSNVRSIKEIFNGKKSYSQIIGYRVAKHEVVEDAQGNYPGKMIQEFLFADSNDVRTIDFIDTQVFPGKKYIYRIHSINFVIGSAYSYTAANSGNTTNVRGELFNYSRRYNSDSQPHFRIIEAPFFEKEVFMADKPPVFPQVNFLPSQGVADKMNILLLQNTDEIEEVPVEVLETDNEHITNMINASRTTVKKDGTVLYGTDTLPEFFEVFRLSAPPKSYKDFAEPELYRKLKATGKSVFFEDTEFEKNTNYYYMFRTIDKAGISNPTQVFRVRMVEYQSGIFMDLELYDFPTTTEQYSMDFTRALQICPAMLQKSLRVNPSLDIDSRDFFKSPPDIDDIDIGNELDEPVWSNQYQMRITSKTSGRKINVNFKFRKNKRVLTKLSDPEPIQSPSNEEPCIPESTSYEAVVSRDNSTDTGSQEDELSY